MTSCSFRTFFCCGATLTGLILTALSGRAATPNAARPNFLIVYTDDQRWDSLSLAGHPFLRTPHMDRIGREGVEFKNAFVTSPLCSPTRASLLTGQYAHAHGVTTNEGAGEIGQRLDTFPRVLQRAGYRTGYIGKWHMGESAEPRPGFDRWVSFAGQGRYTDPELNVDGRTTASNGYIADVLTDRALEFLRESADKPFCLIGYEPAR